jgi:CBS domain-containing protein
VQTGAASDARRLNAVIQNTWPEDMVTVGEHAFLPHFRTEAVRALVAAFGVAPTPVHLERDPKRTARIVILVVAPPKDTPTYLQVLGALARVLSAPENVLALLAAKSPQDIVDLHAISDVELPSHLTVRDVMTRHVYSIGPTETLRSAARFMLEHGVRALPVVEEDGELLGIVTHKELLHHLIPVYVQRSKSGEFRAVTKPQAAAASVDPQDIPVRDVMSRKVLCLSEDQTLAEVANLLNSKDIDRFPVVREGRVVGFLTRADLVRRLLAV